MYHSSRISTQEEENYFRKVGSLGTNINYWWRCLKLLSLKYLYVYFDRWNEPAKWGNNCKKSRHCRYISQQLTRNIRYDSKSRKIILLSLADICTLVFGASLTAGIRWKRNKWTRISNWRFDIKLKKAWFPRETKPEQLIKQAAIWVHDCV